jgi:uncharacterized protein YegP (UPF0339 family)
MARKLKSRLEIFRTIDRQWAWQLVSHNGAVRAIAADTYTTRRACVRGAQRLQQSIKNVEREIRTVELVNAAA